MGSQPLPELGWHPSCIFLTYTSQVLREKHQQCCFTDGDIQVHIQMQRACLLREYSTKILSRVRSVDENLEAWEGSSSFTSAGSRSLWPASHIQRPSPPPGSPFSVGQGLCSLLLGLRIGQSLFYNNTFTPRGSKSALTWLLWTLLSLEGVFLAESDPDWVSSALYIF